MNASTHTHLRHFTIAEYAHYVLDDPRVKEAIERFERYRGVADKMLDAFEMLLDEGLLKFNNAEELSMARAFNKANEETKTRGLAKIIEEIHNFAEPLDLRSIMMRDESQPHPNRSDMPLIMFKAFASHSTFGQYLYTGQLWLISGVYFKKDVDLARQKYLIFALFLWTLYDAKNFFDTRSETYYDEAPTDLDLSQIKLTAAGYEKALRTSTVTERVALLTLFKEYIHFDLWESGDYAKRGKTGTVLRLRFSATGTGQVVIQECGLTNSSCNTVYLVTRETNDLFKEKFLGKERRLEKLDHVFACVTCGALGASFVLPGDREIRFFCQQECFIRLRRRRCKKDLDSVTNQ